MADTVMKDERVILEEMAHHELKVFPENDGVPLNNAMAMWLAYMLGGTVVLLPYFLFPLALASAISVGTSMTGLFFLGIAISHFSLKPWWRSGLETLALSVLSGGIGFLVGFFARHYLEL